LTKLEIIDILSEKSNLKKKDVKLVVDGFLEQIKKVVNTEDKIEIRGFGTFFLQKKSAREIKSPLAEKVISTPAKTV